MVKQYNFITYRKETIHKPLMNLYPKASQFLRDNKIDFTTGFADWCYSDASTCVEYMFTKEEDALLFLIHFGDFFYLVDKNVK